MSSEEMLKGTAFELEKILASKNVMGPPIDLGDKAVIPVARFGFGFGAGGGFGDKSGAEGGGAGGGIEPVAIVVVHKDIKGTEGIRVLSLGKESPIAQVIEALSESLAPQVIDAIKGMKRPEEKVKGPE
jgi:uncharacterized spore protein YtfJ